MVEADVAAHPLPEGVEDAELNKTELAGALSVSTNTVDRWVQQGCPVEEGGANGKAYVFRLSEVWAWYQSSKRAAEERRQAASRAVEQMRLHFLRLGDDQGAAELSLKDRRELAQAELVWMQAAARRRELVPVEEMVDLLERVLGELRDALSALPDRLARELGLDRAQVERAVELCDQALEEARTRIERAELEPRPLEEVEDRPGRLL